MVVIERQDDWDWRLLHVEIRLQQLRQRGDGPSAQ